MMFFKNWWPFRSKDKHKPKKDDYSTLERAYMPVKQLTTGMYIVELDRPWLETPFLFQGFEITTEEELEKVQYLCHYVYVDLTRKKGSRKHVNPHSDAEMPKISLSLNTPPPHKISTFEKEILQSQSIYQISGRNISEFMERIAKGQGIDSKLAQETVAECVNSVLQSPDATLWLSQLKNKDEYTAQHSLNVCILAIVLGRHINLPETYLNHLGLCGMMHDMGKMLVPNKVLYKPSQLEHEEIQIMQSHAALGYELLKSSDNMHPSAIEVAHSHHERMDGKGYPRKIYKNTISQFTKIITIADVYDAVTSDKIYQGARTHLDAVNLLVSMTGSQLDSKFVVKFIESLGVYPPGSIVEMTNGAVAIVIEVNEKMKLRPKVMLILNEEKAPVPERMIDLSKMVKDCVGNIYTIKGIILANRYHLDIGKYYHEDVLQQGFDLGKR